MTTNEQLLSDTLIILNNLFKVIDSLRESYPNIFIDPDIQGSFQDLHNEYKQAIDKLENPTLSIVMIGLTSSGKSTIINSLIGRRIAPTANEEKTAGILTIKHSDTSYLCINGKERGEVLNDKSLYEIIETEMKEYAKNRNDQSLMITVSVPLLFVCNPELLGLPPKIKVELIDLPGIRTSDDEDSINLFKEKGNKAFIIVALDYQNNTDEVKRKKILTQLKPNLDLLNGKTDSLFFILNKFNLRKEEDEPLDTSIRKLQDSVKSNLDLNIVDDVVIILPFNALLLYYAQCAWGPTSHRDTSSVASVDQEIRKRLLKEMIEYCGNTINQKKLGNKDLRNWFQNLEDLIDEGKDIDDKTTQQILNYALDWTKGEELWKQLRVRFQESFPELVVLPALNHFFKCYDDLVSKIDSTNKTRIYNSVEIQEKRTELSENRRNLPQSIENISHSFQEQINGYIEEFRNIKNIQELQPILQKLDQDNISGFDTIINIFKDIKDDLEILIIKTIQNALKFEEPDYRLRERLTTDSQMGIKIRERDVNDITENYSLVLGMFSESNSAEEEERRVRHLYESVSEAISDRTNMVLKFKSLKLDDAIEKLYNNQNSKLKEVIDQVKCNDLSLTKTITDDFNKDVDKNLLRLPDNFFNFKLTREIEPHRKSNFWKDLWRKLTMKDDPNKSRNVRIADMIAEEWSEGINEKERELWDFLSDWIKASLEESSNRFQNSTVKAIKLLDREFEVRSSNFEQESANKQKIYEHINNTLKVAQTAREDLEKKCYKPMKTLPPESIQRRL